jgi:hypothetical protein
VLAKTLTVGLKGEPSSIDPHYHNLGPNNALAREVFEHEHGIIVHGINLDHPTPNYDDLWEFFDKKMKVLYRRMKKTMKMRTKEGDCL